MPVIVVGGGGSVEVKGHCGGGAIAWLPIGSAFEALLLPPGPPTVTATEDGGILRGALAARASESYVPRQWNVPPKEDRA